MKQIIQVLGPTGIGKSLLAVRLAREIGGEIISADSMQVYQDFDIGTAKLDPGIRQQVPHHLIDILSDCSQYNAARFLEMSYQVSEDIISRDLIPIVCGGTALYLRTMIRGIFPEKADKRVSREAIEREAHRRGLPSLWEELNRVDPEYAAKIGPNDRVRIIRGLEIYYNQGEVPTKIFERTRTPFQDYSFIRIGLTIEREELYRKINHRVDDMFGSGFVSEVKALRSKYPPECPPFGSLGYREIVQYLEGEMDLETAILMVKQHTRNFAKRQLSWFRGEPDITWFDPGNSESIFQWVRNRISGQGLETREDL